MFNKMLYVFALCFLAVNAQNNTDAKIPVTDSATVKVEPKSISSLYIGDLLRTKPNDDLDAAGSYHQPTRLNKDFLSSPVLDQPQSYKTHGAHDYSEAEYSRAAPASRSNTPTVIKKLGNEGRGFPVMGHILTLKPVRVVPADTLPAARSPEKHHQTAHYSNDDCSKSNDHSYSSEETPHVHDQPTYRRAKQIDPSPEPEYRSPQSRYSDEDRSGGYSSHSDPSSGTYRSKTHASDTNSKSQSSGSYSKSVSKSSSKTLTPKSKKGVRLVPTEIGPGLADQKIVVYKVREPENQKPSPDHSERDYPPPDYEGEPNTPSPEPHYHQQTSSGRKSRKPSYERPTHYSTSAPKRRPPHYEAAQYEHNERQPPQYEHNDERQPPQYEHNDGKPPQYQHDEGSDGQNSYAHGGDQRYKEQGKPASNYHDSEYSHRPNTQEPGYKSHSQTYSTSEGGAPYETEPPRKPHKKSHRHNERPSNEGREKPLEYRPLEYSTTEYSYPPERKAPSHRNRKERPQSSYPSYPYQEDRTEPPQQPQSYGISRPVHRPTEEKQHNQYTYEATPQQTTIKHGNRSPQNRPYRESSRYARSPGRRGHPAAVEGRNLPAAGNEPFIPVGKETKPYLSRSVSYSENHHNAGINPKVNYAAQQILPNEGRQAAMVEQPTVYKPYNSEYPASYANDQHHHNVAEQHTSRTYQRPYTQSQSYKSPSHSQTYSHSSGGRGRPQQYQPYQDEGYDDDDEESSYEQDSGPQKKNKDHHYISNIEGFKDTYGKDEPLNIDEDFFKKYGISPNAKVIVASAKKPNLFVADGTNIKEGDYFSNSKPSYGHSSGSGEGYGSGPSSGSGYGHSSGASYEQGPSGPGYGHSSGPSSVDSEEDSYEPNYKNNYKQDSSKDSREELEPPKQIPGSFDDLVDTNPKFLRNLPELLKGQDVFFDSSEVSFDGVEFPKVGEQRGYIVSQGPREIVQQHGDGVSRIMFNVPKNEFNTEARNAAEAYDKQNEEKIIEAASKIIENIIKTDS